MTGKLEFAWVHVQPLMHSNIHQIVHTAMHVGPTARRLIAVAEWMLNEIHELINRATIIAMA